MNPVREIVIIFLLILVNGYFSAAEIALISARKISLKRLAAEGSKGAQAAIGLVGEDSTKLLATIQVAITLVGMLASAMAAVSLAQPVQVWLLSLGIKPLSAVAAGLSVVLVTLMISYVTLVVGELVPKRLGLQRAEAVAIATARPIKALSIIAGPIVWLLTRSTALVARLVGAGDNKSAEGISEEEIKLLVTEQGSLLEEEKRMIHAIFELNDTVAREVMAPRVDILFLEDTVSVSDAARIIQPTGFSRVPIFHEDHDSVIGVVILKDLVIPLDNEKGDSPITDYMRPAVFVPESKKILDLLEEMQAHRNQLVIVVDEYGGTAGILTMEDIVEEVVGEISDEFDKSRALYREIRPQKWVIEGNLPIEDALELGFPLEDSDEYETVAGWMLDQLGHIPRVGESFSREDYLFTVQNMRRKRIVRIRVEQLETSLGGESDEREHE